LARSRSYIGYYTKNLIIVIAGGNYPTCIVGAYEPEIINGEYNMEINKDFDFEVCETCPSLHDCEARCSCKIEEMLLEDVAKQRGEDESSLWGGSE
jgi:hypothetical protein